MLEDLHITLANFRVALTKFWEDYTSEIGLSEIADMGAAGSVFRHYQAMLDQVLDLRECARRIDGILHAQPLTSLHKKEN